MSALRIIGLLDVVRVTDPALMRQVADDPLLDRRSEGGPLLSRLVRRQLARTLRTPEGALPSALPRDSRDRRDLRQALYALLAAPDLETRLDGAIADCAAYMAGGPGAPGPLAQTLFGRIFVPGFTADRRTWEAAETLDRGLGAPSPRALADRLFGRLSRAQADLSRAMNGDRNGVHAIGVAAHNFAASLKTMRALDPATPADKAAALALVVPDRVPRQAASAATSVAGPLRPGTLVLLQTAAAHARSLDRRDAFLSGTWSGCPADALVPRLIAEVWTRARGAS